MTTEVQQIYIRQGGAWQPISKVKVRKDGAWGTVKGVHYAGSWHVVRNLVFQDFNVQVDVSLSGSSPVVVGKYKIITSS